MAILEIQKTVQFDRGDVQVIGRLFRWLTRLIHRIFVLTLLCVLAIAGYLIYDGYQMYQDALAETPIQQVMEEIKAKPNYTTIDQIPPIYLNAVLAAEDRRFYQHHGLDVIAIARAMYHNVQAGTLVEGGSTITQQLAKNQFFTQKKELTRKIAEVFMVWEMEKLYEKDEILELYINSIYYGDGYYCIADASMGYFGKQPWQMNAYECTLLVGIPNAPSVYAPTVNPELAAQRQQQVLADMVRWNFLTSEEAAAIAP